MFALSWWRRKREPGSPGPAKLVGLAEPVELIGLVGPRGTSGSRWGDAKDWTLNSDFIAWRRVGGELASAPLHLSHKCDYQTLQQLQKQLPDLSVARVRARIGPAGKAELVKILAGAVRDDELEALAKQLSEPLVRPDPEFGPLSFDRRLDWWAGKVSWCGKPVSISFHAVEAEELDKCLANARDLFLDAPSWDARVRAFAANDLLELKNDTWLGEDESEVSEEEFKSRMVMESLSFHPGGEIEFWFADGDLFWGHSIQVDATLVDGPTAAQMCG